MRSKSRMRMALRLALASAGASSGKNFNTGSSKLNFPSEIASPTAVDVKLLLNEYIECGVLAAYGDHQPSATTWPCRTSMKLFIASTWRSADVTKSRIAAEEIPWASGVLRGKGVELSAATRPAAARERNSVMA